MKKFTLLFVAILGLNVSQAQTNLIPNGDLSQWIENVPTGFMLDVTSGSEAFFAKATETYNGKNALAMSYMNNGVNPVRMICTPTLSLSPGTYILSFALKGEGYLKMVSLSTSTATRDQRIDLKSSTTTNIVNWRPQGQETYTKTLDDWTTFDSEYDEPVEIIIEEPGDYQFNFCHNNGRTSDGQSYVLMIADIVLKKDDFGSNMEINNDEFKISTSDLAMTIEKEGSNTYSVYDVKGSIIESGSFTDNKTVESLNSGLYILKVNGIVKKVLIK